jgi:hypothetical protein
MQVRDAFIITDGFKIISLKVSNSLTSKSNPLAWIKQKQKIVV